MILEYSHKILIMQKTQYKSRKLLVQSIFLIILLVLTLCKRNFNEKGGHCIEFSPIEFCFICVSHLLNVFFILYGAILPLDDKYLILQLNFNYN